MSVQPAPSVCEVCGGRGYVRERRGERAAARVCECSRHCARCGNSGYALQVRESTFSEKVGKRSYEVLAPCECQVRLRRLERFSEAGIPPVLTQADFEGYRPFPGAQFALQVARDFAESFSRGTQAPGFILSGPVGTGKTHLLAAVLSHVTLAHGVQARYQEISLLYQDIRRGFREGKSGGEIIGPLCEVELLAIDELGKGRGSQFELETLDELIARRYNAGKVTLFATNYSLEAGHQKPSPAMALSGYVATEAGHNAAREPQLLRERVGERIFSRLCDMCTFVELPANTPDYRVMRQELELRNQRPRGRGR